MVIELCSLLRTDEEVGGKPDVCTNTAARLRRYKTDRGVVQPGLFVLLLPLERAPLRPKDAANERRDA